MAAWLRPAIEDSTEVSSHHDGPVRDRAAAVRAVLRDPAAGARRREGDHVRHGGPGAFFRVGLSPLPGAAWGFRGGGAFLFFGHPVCIGVDAPGRGQAGGRRERDGGVP